MTDMREEFEKLKPKPKAIVWHKKSKSYSPRSYSSIKIAARYNEDFELFTAAWQAAGTGGDAELVGWVWDSYSQTNFTTGSDHKELLEAIGVQLTPAYTHPTPAAPDRIEWATGKTITREQAIKILETATNNEDPYWVDLVEDFYDEETDSWPSIYDVFAAIGVTKAEYMAVTGAENVDNWPAAPQPVGDGEVCSNCGTPLPVGCGGLFTDDGSACLRNAQPPEGER